MNTKNTLLFLILLMGLASFPLLHILHETSSSSSSSSSSPSVKEIGFSSHLHDLEMAKLHGFKASILKRSAISFPSAKVSFTNPFVYKVTAYGADPTGKKDSTDAIEKALLDAMKKPHNGFLFDRILNLGGVQIHLEGGYYVISRPLKLLAGRGNLMIHGGTLKASDSFPTDGYLIDISESTKSVPYHTEFVTLRNLLLDSNYRGGGILVVNALRTSIDNCYITHFTTNGIFVQGGHETYVRNSFLGQHITAGADPGEKNFSGTGITLMGNDNAITDVVIFSAEIGIVIAGEANTIAGVHCYNKATVLGGTGIHLMLPGLTQTRIVHSYFDYTGIIAEDPVQLDISSCYFLGDGYVLLRSIKGVINGVNIVDNMFSGSNTGIDIVQLDQRRCPFKQIDQVVIDRNNVNGMKLRTTIARGTIQGNGSSWTLDFNSILLFRDLVKYVEYTLQSTSSDGSIPKHVLRNVSNNQVLIESDVPVQARVFAMINQGQSYSASSRMDVSAY